MALKDGNKVIQVTLTPYHQKKLSLIRNRTGLSNSGIIQRWIEGQDIFDEEMLEKEKEQEE